jgi:DNA-directed RNA polymerase subunit alpha
MPDVTNFVLPSRLVLEEETATKTYGRFIAEPLENGFGQTVGNALRRILLSSLEGTSVTSIKIDGVSHEFGPIPDIIEDATDIVLNFKKILLECSGEVPRKLELHTTRAGEIKAGDITSDGVTTILNPDLVLCTVDKPRELRVEIEINRGRGYHSADENKGVDKPIGVIPIDSLYSPVTRVAYHVHACRVGQRTDYDRLEIEIWTDGRIAPADALKHSANILMYHMSVFTGVNGRLDDGTSSLITNAEDEAMLKKLLTNVNDLELSVRAQNCLNNANICTIGELVQRSESEMMKYRNFGQKSLNELKEKLTEMGLHLGYELKEEVRLAFRKEQEKSRIGS